MTQGSNAAELEELEMQVRKARQFVRQSELKVEAIVASIHEIEKFYPKIKIIRRPVAPKVSFGVFAANLVLNDA